jgi:hypothetical protein
VAAARRWDPARRHRCPACDRAVVTMGRASSWRAYQCPAPTCQALFARWPWLAPLLPRDGAVSWRGAAIGTYDSAAGQALARAIGQHARAAARHARQGNLAHARQHLEQALADVDYVTRNVPDERLPHAPA